mmetsp:Transcript_62075/g.140419  ORF Transcript_62075/g.140419 Transcript_62075/m.140419 type:complete len:107 (-) Transcript_62075:357-677(-)
MSKDFLKRAQPCDQQAVNDMVDGIKAFFTGTMATRGRRADLDRSVLFAAAAAVIPKGVRENRQMRAFMRLTGLRHDAVSKAITYRTRWVTCVAAGACPRRPSTSMV